MKKLNLALILSLGLFTNSCNSVTDKTTGGIDTIEIPEEHLPKKMIKLSEIQYDISCMTGDEDDNVLGLINLLADEHEDLVSMFTKEVTPQQEMEFGKEGHEEIKEEIKVKNNSKLTAILNKLTQEIPDSKYDYKIYEVEDDIVNAFTFGARIYIYKGIIDFCQSESELAAVIAHEISHNELGHINKKLRPFLTLSSFFGESLAGIATAIEGVLTTPFGQKDEVMADLMGVDLVYHAEYNGCEAINVWERMSKEEEYNELEEMFRSHPYSSRRATCIQNHISKNYEVDCD